MVKVSWHMMEQSYWATKMLSDHYRTQALLILAVYGLLCERSRYR